MFVSLEKKFNFDIFLENVFGTNDRKKFSRVIQNFAAEATLIIDNIQLAREPSGKLNEELFTFINGYLMQTLRMNIIMLSSQSRTDYEIQSGPLLKIFYLINSLSFWL